MGWQGGGLGLKEQGREAPIEAGEARANIDKFAGIGLAGKADPFENFRKQRSQGFMDRMKTRDPKKVTKIAIDIVLNSGFNLFYFKFS